MNASRGGSLAGPEIIVVEASAGTGKTYALAVRYVQLLLSLTVRRSHQPPPIHSILAITFTNKAAFEMKGRILRLLKEIALGVLPDGERRAILDPLGMGDALAQRTARTAMDAILKHYHHFQVQTIDKFINTLLVSCAFQIGLTAGFRISSSPRAYLAQALDSVIDEAAGDPAVRKAFDDFLVSMLLVESRIAWLPREVVLDTMEQLFSEKNTYALDFAADSLRPADILEVKTAVLEDVRAFVRRMPEGAHATFARSLSKFADEHDRGFSFGQGVSAYFEPGKPVAFTKALRLLPWHEEQWARIQSGMLRAADAEVRHLYDPYIGIFRRVAERLDAICRREDVIFLSQLNAIARQVHEKGVAPEELYYHLAARFEHYLFDEFQDTSVLQWENLRALPEDAVARGGSLFYVGDRKQAIFSFRGGETRLFDSISARYEDQGYEITRHQLNMSRRSHAAIVNFNNAVFSMENLTAFMNAVDHDGYPLVPARPEDRAELERVYVHARQEVLLARPEGGVRVGLLEGTGRQEVRSDARVKVIARLRELLLRFSPGEIGILVRKNDEVEEVTRWLMEEGIPSSSERALNVRQHVRVTEITALMRFLVTPADDAAFGEFIQGMVFAAASGIPQDELRDAVLAWRMTKGEALHVFFRRSFPVVWTDLMQGIIRDAALYPLYETVAGLYRRLGLLVNFPDDQGFFMHFLEIVRANEDEFPDMASFLGHFESMEGEGLYVELPGGDAVEVMTVHKAKGLEFRAVILPFLTVSLRRGRAPGQKSLDYVLQKDDGRLHLFHINAGVMPFSPLAEALGVNEKMAMFFAELNNAYVALTRAACEMHVFIPPRAGTGPNLALKLIPEGYYSVGDTSGVYPGRDTEAAPLSHELAPPACREWISFLDDAPLAGQPRPFARERDEGEFFHAVLAGASPVIGEDSAGCLEVLERFCAAAAVRPFFDAPGAEVFVEKEFVDRRGSLRRMDRVLVFSDEVRVADFKARRSGLLTDDAQVRDYMAILRDIYPGHRVRGYLLFIHECEVLEVGT